MNPILSDKLVDKVEAMPDDIWISIFKYFANEPVLFNLYNINSQLTRVMDHYFRKHVVLDFNKYIKLNNKIKINDQVNYVMDYCNRTMIILLLVTSENETYEVEPAIQNILDRDALQLNLFRSEQAPIIPGCGINVECIRDVMNRAVNLVDVSFTIPNAIGIIDMASLVNLQSLKISKNGYNPPENFLRLPIVGLTSLELYQCDIEDFTNGLIASRNTLQSLNLQGVSIYQENNTTNDTMTLFVFPSLKCITVKSVQFRGVIDLRESLLLESISVYLLFGTINVVGLDFRIHRFIKDVESTRDAINLESFAMPDACLDNLKSLEFQSCTDVAFITSALNRLAFGCDRLEYIGLRNLTNDNMVAELLNQISKIIANNKKLRKFNFWYHPKLFQSIIQSIMDTKNEHLECMEIIVEAMPDDIWIIIFKYFAKEPVLFNLYNINSQLTRVMDHYFRKHVVLDFNKYIKLNNKIKIDDQVNYIMDYCNRTVSEIIIMASEHEICEFNPTIQNILGINCQQLKLFHYEHTPLIPGCGITVECIRDVMHRAINLVDVSITVCNLIGIIDLSTLVNLRSLTFFNRGRFYPVADYLIRLPIVGLTTLKLYQCQIDDLTNVLIASRNTLVALNLEDVAENITKNTLTSFYSFVFPNLKYITVSMVELHGVIGLKESLLLESISVLTLPPSDVNVVGLDFRVHRFIKDVKSDVDSINFESFAMPDACLDNLKSLELNWCKDVASITSVLNRLAYGCGELEYIGLRNKINGNMIAELLNQIPKVIASNKKLRKFGFWYNQELLHSVIQSIIDTKNESLECIEISYMGSTSTVDQLCNFLLGTLAELDYERSKKLQIKIIDQEVSDDVRAIFLSRFNIDFVGVVLFCCKLLSNDIFLS